ncbi:MAG: ATP-dependent Clp protease ATP-binding subunit [Patescibacteria group bacterium]|jgi:ATP-dependent Clp protease ATP-binding subunit ClpC
MDLGVFKKFSDNLKKVLVTSERIAKEQNTVMDTEHQLMALLMVKDTLAYEILSSFEIASDRVEVVVSLVSKRVTQAAPDGLTEEAKEAIKSAVSIASQYGHYAVDTEHLLLALLSNKEFNSYAVIERIGVNPDDLKKQIETIFGGIKDTLQSLSQGLDQSTESSNPPSVDMPEMESFNPMGQFSNMGQSTTKTKSESFLSSFTTNLTKLAQNGKLDPVVGRDNETERLIQILCRRTKNNPVLIGEPGIGKTSIVEGLAQRIVDGKVPVKLVGKEILSIDMGALLAGTMYRGQFESRVKKLLAEIKKSGNVVLFIDEIHTVVGAGSTEGSIDAANLLKPMLSRGELHLIGSTTLDEYKKHIERDPAFERRFQPIVVKEPTVPEAIEILRGIKTRYEKYHNVKYTAEAIESAVKLSKRYINDRFLPDKAIDLIDEAAAATNTVSSSTADLANLRRELRQILRRKEEYIMAEQYEKATRLREDEIRIENAIKLIKLENKPSKEKIITVDDIATVASRWTGVPVTDLTAEEKKRYLDLEKRIKQHIVGQDEAVLEVTKAIKRARVGIANPNRPTGSFIFLGPTGVGKTELARVLAAEVLGDRNALVKIDMSEFMERHNVSRLIGAPAGYVGYEEGGKLTEAIRRQPYSVILFDEIEKAHPEVFNILLQIMEDGELTDAKGRKVDFKNTILVMTSNLGTNIFDKRAVIGFATGEESEEEYEKLRNSVFEEMEEFFKPEFLNRVDKVIVFRPLSREAIIDIVELQIKELANRLHEQKIKLIVEKPAKEWLAENGFDPDFGARPIRKIIGDHIETPLAEAILQEEFEPGNVAVISKKGDHIYLHKAEKVVVRTK